MYGFGAGSLFAIPSGTTPTPVQFGTLQEVALDFSFSQKELKGQYQFPEAVGRTGSKITGKAKTGRIQGNLMDHLFFGDGAAKTTGQIKAAINEAGTIPASGTYTVTVANAANFNTDLGVTQSNGTPLTRVASDPDTGEYAVDTATGIYTFAAADAGDAVKISYLYDVAATGYTLALSNQLMGLNPTFMVILTNDFNSQQIMVMLNSCTSTKLTLPTKSEDFVIPEFDFAAQADSSGNIGKISGPDY